MTITTKLFDTTSFNLDARYPRPSLVHDKDGNPLGAPLLSRQPFTALYLLVYVPVLLIVVPPYAVLRWLYVEKVASCGPGWPLKEFVAVYAVRHTLHYWWCLTQGGIRGFFHGRLSDAQRTRRRRLFGAMPDEVAPLALDALVEPMRTWARETKAEASAEPVSVWWMGDRSKALKQLLAKPKEKLLVYLTGGGYMVSSCHPVIPLSHLNQSMMHAFQAHAASDKANAHFLPRSSVTVEYRKSGEAATPAALMDCIALYVHVVDRLGFAPEDIVLLGDSAGGHLVNSLIRYLLDARRPAPHAAILISPWTDQAGTIVEHPHSSYQRNIDYDVLSDEFYHTCRDTFAMHFADPASTLLDVYFSPCAVLGKVRNGKRTLTTEEDEARIFAGWPRVFLVGLHGDVLLDQTTEMARRVTMSKRVEGVSDDKLDREVHLCIMQGCHDPFIAPGFVFGAGRKKALKEMAAWLVAGS